MIPKKILIFLALISIATAIPADERLVTKRGKTIYPYFNKTGKVNFIISDNTGKASLISPAKYSIDDISTRNIQSLYNFRAPQIKKDRYNQAWLIWEHGKDQEEHVFLARIQEEKICCKIELSLGIKGSNHSPSLIFSPHNQAWAAWVNVYQGKNQIIVKNIASSVRWSIFPGSCSIYSPQIIADRDGSPWLFWTAAEDRPDKIYYSFFNGERWAPPSILASNLEVPHFHPAVTLNENGFPWVTWCSYDGQDYEIYTTSWNGEEWLEIEKITNNSTYSDVEPSISLYLDSIPMISWTRAGNGKRDIFISFKIEGNWYPAINISHDFTRSGSPVLITDGDKIAVSWKDEEFIYAKHLSFFELQTKRHPEIEKETSISSAHLARNRFIGFGDSITFGSMDGPYMGKGYIPRLQELLKNIYAEPLISNRGVPGEPTWEALSRIESVISADLALYLLLMEGTNDVTTTEYSMNTTAFNLEQIVQKSLDYGVFPLISTIIPRARNRWTASAQQRTFDLNSKIETIAQDLHILLVENFTAFYNYPEEQGGYASLISTDNLHPNNTGYQVMAETWYEKISSAPFPPVNIQALIRQRDKVIILEWEKNAKVIPAAKLTNYRIYRKKSGDPGFTAKGIVDSEQFSYHDENIDPEQEYIYALSSINEDNIEGPMSELVQPIIGDPYPPVNISTYTVINKAFLYREYINRLTWEGNPQNQGQFTITKYRIYRKSRGEEDTMFLQIGEVYATQTEFLDRNLSSQEAAESYVYGVSSVDDEDNESITNKG